MSKTKIPCSELPWGQLPSPTVQASAVTSPFCCALQKCVLGWVRAGLPGSSITAFGSHQKCLLPGPHISFHILRGISFWFACFSLILFFSFFRFFFLNQTTVEDMSLEGVSGGHSVQCPPPSGASQVDRVAQGRISGKRHSNPAHLFQGLTTLLGRTFKVLSALSTFIISPSFSACPRSICHCLASALIHMLLSGILCALCTRFAEALVPSLQLAHTIHPFSKRTRKKMLKNALGTECREHTWV